MKTGDLARSMWKDAFVLTLDAHDGRLVPGIGPFICVGDVGNHFKVILLPSGELACARVSELEVIK